MVERKHRHIVELGLTLLAQSSVPMHYWTNFFFFTVVFLINKLPSTSLNNSSPHELLFRYKPDYSFIRVFVCLCFPHIRPYRSQKLSFCYELCVFWGYCSDHHGYRCLSSSGRLYISRNVVFHETTFPFADSINPFFTSLSPKCSTPSKPFFILYDPFFQQPPSMPTSASDSSGPSPDLPTSSDSVLLPSSVDLFPDVLPNNTLSADTTPLSSSSPVPLSLPHVVSSSPGVSRYVPSGSTLIPIDSSHFSESIHHSSSSTAPSFTYDLPSSISLPNIALSSSISSSQKIFCQYASYANSVKNLYSRLHNVFDQSR